MAGSGATLAIAPRRPAGLRPRALQRRTACSAASLCRLFLSPLRPQKPRARVDASPFAELLAA